MLRRDFLTRLAGAPLAAGFLASGKARGRPPQSHASRPSWGDKREHISISTWSLHNYFQSTREADCNLPGAMLALLDFPEMIAERYKVHNLEFCAPHFASTESAYLVELKSRLVRTHSRLVNIPVDIEEIWTQGGLSDPVKEVREAAVNASKKWIDIAAKMGSRAVRCDPGRMDPKHLGPTVESYKTLAAYAQSKGVQVIIENHGGVGSEHPEELIGLFKRVGIRILGALPDFGNFPDEPTREKGLALLFPYARVVCHAKGLEIDSRGEETKFDFPKCVEISKKAGYRGVYSIEYEGPGDPYEGVQKVLDELLKYL
jgi:sugar phosphate isomerase/epimerase